MDRNGRVSLKWENKIVANSSDSGLELKKTAFAFALLKAVTNDTVFADDAALDVESTVSRFCSCKGKSGTSCPDTAMVKR